MMRGVAFCGTFFKTSRGRKSRLQVRRIKPLPKIGATDFDVNQMDLETLSGSITLTENE